MVTNQPKSLQSFGKNKGFIFSMDAVFALIMVIMILTISNIYLSRIEFSSISDLQIIKRSNDLFKILNENPNNGTDYIVLANFTDFNINTTLRDIIFAANGPNNIPNIDINLKFTARCFNYTNTGLFNKNYTYISPHIVPTAILEYAKKSSFIEFFRLESRLFMLSRAPISAILLSS